MNNQNQPSRGALKGRIHCKIFLSEHSWNIVSGAFHEPWNTFMKYFYFSIWMSLRMFLTNTKNCIYREKISSDSKNLIALIFINNICCSKQKQKNKKRPKRIWIKPWLKNRNDKKHVLAYSQNFGWLTNSNIIFEWMLYHTIDQTIIFINWLLLTFYLTYTYNSTVCIDFFDASTVHIFHFTNNFFSITQLKQ